MLIRSLAAIQADLTFHTPANEKGKALKDALSFFVDADTQLDASEVRSRFFEVFPPQMLYDKDILTGPNNIYTVIRDYLVLNGVPYQHHPARNCITWGLFNQNIPDQKDRDWAYLALSPNPHTSTSNGAGANGSSPAQNLTSGTENASCLAHNMSSRFRKVESKFSGALDQSYVEYLNNYLDAAREYSVNNDQELKLFIKILTGEAKSIFRQYVDGVAATSNEGNRIMLVEFDSPTRQGRVKKQLDQLRVAKIMATDIISVALALEKVREEITKKADQGPRTHRDEAHK